LHPNYNYQQKKQQCHLKKEQPIKELPIANWFFPSSGNNRRSRINYNNFRWYWITSSIVYSKVVGKELAYCCNGISDACSRYHYIRPDIKSMCHRQSTQYDTSCSYYNKSGWVILPTRAGTRLFIVTVVAMNLQLLQ
jgi:hypothetical protein